MLAEIIGLILIGGFIYWAFYKRNPEHGQRERNRPVWQLLAALMWMMIAVGLGIVTSNDTVMDMGVLVTLLFAILKAIDVLQWNQQKLKKDVDNIGVRGW